MQDTKKQLGQYYSTNSYTLLKDFDIPDTVIDPFVGNGDLLKWAAKNGLKKYIAYDISPSPTLRYKCITRDTLSNPPDYKNRFVLTNPPYLAKNKSADKGLFGTHDDLYKLFISQIISGDVIGGIIIIPLNFLCSVRTSDVYLRGKFFSKYVVKQINIFLNPIFADTTYTVCSIRFDRSDALLSKQNVKIYWHDDSEYDNIELNDSTHWLFGSEIYLYMPSENFPVVVGRLTEKTDLDNVQVLNIRLNGLDTRDAKICLAYNTDHYVGKNTDRMFATLTISNLNRDLSPKEQRTIVRIFNNMLNSLRDKYKSMFLTNYRDFGRKRIGFDLVYNLVGYIVETEF